MTQYNRICGDRYFLGEKVGSSKKTTLTDYIRGFFCIYTLIYGVYERE